MPCAYNPFNASHPPQQEPQLADADGVDARIRAGEPWKLTLSNLTLLQARPAL